MGPVRRLALAVAGTVACLAPAQPGHAGQTSVVYGCEGRFKLHVTFDSDAGTATVSASHLGTLTMQAVPSGDGFHYKSGKYQLRGRGNQASWHVGMSKPLPCVAE